MTPCRAATALTHSSARTTAEILVMDTVAVVVAMLLKFVKTLPGTI
jgi:hypothetical protein